MRHLDRIKLVYYLPVLHEILFGDGSDLHHPTGLVISQAVGAH